MTRSRYISAAIVATAMLAGSASFAQQQQAPARPQAQPAQPVQRPSTPPPKPQQQRPAQPRQQPQRPAQPTPPQQQPQQPAQQPAQPAPAALPPLTFSRWTKLCLNHPSGKLVCFTGKDARLETGVPLVGAALIEPEGEPKKVLRVNLPLGVKIQSGTRVIIDQNQPRTAPFVVCFPTGCVADYDVNVDMINQMKQAQDLHIQAIAANGQPFTLALPLAGFAGAHDGPPTDPKVIEEEQKKLQEELRRKREETQNKSESPAQSGATR